MGSFLDLKRENLKKMNNKYKKALKDIKLLLREQGRSTLISTHNVDKVFVKYDISLSELVEKIKCDGCGEEKEPYYEGSNLCKDCAIKMDEHIEGGLE